MFVTLDTTHLLMSALKDDVPEKTYFRFVTSDVLQFSISPYFATTASFKVPPAIQSETTLLKVPGLLADDPSPLGTGSGAGTKAAGAGVESIGSLVGAGEVAKVQPC